MRMYDLLSFSSTPLVILIKVVPACKVLAVPHTRAPPPSTLYSLLCSLLSALSPQPSALSPRSSVLGSPLLSDHTTLVLLIYPYFSPLLFKSSKIVISLFSFSYRLISQPGEEAQAASHQTRPCSTFCSIF